MPRRAAALHRLPAPGPAVAGLVGDLRPRLRESRPARLRRASSPAASLPSGGKSGWGSGFLPSVYQGVQCRSGGDPVLYVSDPAGMDRALRRMSLDALRDLNELQAARLGDPETPTRIAQYELAFRMQIVRARGDGHFDASRRTARSLRRPAGRGRASPTTACWPGVWSSRACASCSSSTGAGTSTAPTPAKTSATDLIERCTHDGPARRGTDSRPEAARAARRHAGRLGRRIRPHAVPRRPHGRGRTSWAATIIPYCYTMLMAGGGMKPGMTYGATDELGFYVTENPVHVARPAGHDPAPAGPRPHAADLSLPGPRLPPDRRRRPRD